MRATRLLLPSLAPPPCPWVSRLSQSGTAEVVRAAVHYQADILLDQPQGDPRKPDPSPRKGEDMDIEQLVPQIMRHG